MVHLNRTSAIASDSTCQNFQRYSAPKSQHESVRDSVEILHCCIALESCGVILPCPVSYNTCFMESAAIAQVDHTLANRRDLPLMGAIRSRNCKARIRRIQADNYKGVHKLP